MNRIMSDHAAGRLDPRLQCLKNNENESRSTGVVFWCFSACVGYSTWASLEAICKRVLLSLQKPGPVSAQPSALTH